MMQAQRLAPVQQLERVPAQQLGLARAQQLEPGQEQPEAQVRQSQAR